MEPHPPRAERTTSFMMTSTSDVTAMERLLDAFQPGETASQQLASPQYLLFRCAGIRVAISLVSLRVVLPSTPPSVPLPFSPPWFLGIFPLRNEMLGLVDPAPVLFPHVATMNRDALTSDPRRQARAAIVVGDDEQALAWVVDDFGDIAQMVGEDIVAYEARPDDQVSASRYALNMLRCPESGDEYVILDAHAALADMLAALVESDRPDA